MLNAVIILLREVLEAALIISVLTASSKLFDHKSWWLGCALMLGMGAALLYAWQLEWISGQFNGVGQEVFNAVLQIAIFGLLVIFNWGIIRSAINKSRSTDATLSGLLPALCVALAITREGSEIFIYLYGFSYSREAFLPVLTGGSIGTGIGISVGVLLYYTIIYAPNRVRLWLVCGVTTLVAAGMVSQAAQLLIQADMLPSQMPLWDTTFLLPENSVLGQLLYALVSYESTPTAIEVITYWLGLALMLTAQWLGWRQAHQLAAPLSTDNQASPKWQ